MMKRKISLRIDEGLYLKLSNESKKFGYRSVSSYMELLLEKRTVVEIAGGTELSKAIFRYLRTTDNRSEEQKEAEICQSLNLLMTRIEQVMN